MWVEEKPSWLRMVVLRGAALPSIWTRALAVAFLSLIVTILYEKAPGFHHSVTPVPFTLLGLPLSIFLGFRNSAAYDRFWEGRKIWGQIVNTSRSFTRQVLTIVRPLDEADLPAEKETEKALVHLLIAWVHSLRHHLRDEDPRPTIERIIPGTVVEGEPNIPVALLQRIADRLAIELEKGRINPFHYPLIEASLTVLTDQQGAAERIKSTPVPFSYAVLIHRIVAGYCVLLPFGLFESAEWATPVVVLVVSYALFGLDAIGDEIEQPFGYDNNDLALDSITTSIEGTARARIGEPIPPKVQPKDYVLS